MLSGPLISAVCLGLCFRWHLNQIRSWIRGRRFPRNLAVGSCIGI